MKIRNIILILSVLAVILAVLGYQQDLYPGQRLARLFGIGTTPSAQVGGPSSTEVDSDQENRALGINLESDTTLTYDDVQLVLSNVDVTQKRDLLENQTAFRDFIQQEASQLSLLAAANANNIQQDANARLVIQRGAENIIREIYINRLVNTKIPADYPSEDQMNQYYEANKDNLVVEERLSVWQIFLPATEGISGNELTALESQATQIANDIRQNRTDFTTAALNYSQHVPSKLNGGYMGILKVSELMPGIHESLMELDEGEVSSPVRTEMGYHILKRDQIIPAQDVSLEQIREQIRNLMVNQTRTKLRNEIQALALETYPVELDEAAIDEWRRRLQSDM